MRDCAATPAVADPASTVTMAGVQTSASGGVNTGEENAEGHEPGHGDDVVEGGSPGEGPEDFAGVQHFTEQTVERIKQDLGQTPVGKSDRQRYVVGTEPATTIAAALGIERDQRRRQKRCQDCHGEEDHKPERDDLVDEALPTVFVEACFDNVGNEHRAENTAGDNGVDVVGELVSQSKGVSAGTDGAKRSGKDDGADEPQDPGHHSA